MVALRYTAQKVIDLLFGKKIEIEILHYHCRKAIQFSPMINICASYGNLLFDGKMNQYEGARFLMQNPLFILSLPSCVLNPTKLQ
jgi:hypothetical protein